MKYVIVFAGTFLASLVGSQFLPDAWYQELAKPALTPPDAVFGPIWTVFYLMMATAASLVWQRSAPGAARWPLTLYAVQLGLNALWSPLFFGLHAPFWSLVDLVVMWLGIAATMIVFFRRVKIAGLLLAPYLAWVTFAGYLNAGLWRLNG